MYEAQTLNSKCYNAHRSARLKQQKNERRSKFSKMQVKILEATFLEKKYLDKTTKEDLASRLGVEQEKIKIWFQNRRTKYRKFNNISARIRLDHNVHNLIGNIIHKYSGYCPTCLLPVHYSSYQDGKWVYSRSYNDCISNQSTINESQEHLDCDCHQNVQDLGDTFKRERRSQNFQEDYDSILHDVEELCK